MDRGEGPGAVGVEKKVGTALRADMLRLRGILAVAQGAGGRLLRENIGWRQCGKGTGWGGGIREGGGG